MDSELKSKLGTKGTKCKMQFTASERDYLINECGFTDEETDVFLLRARGKTVLQISFILTEKYADDLMGCTYTEGKVERRIRSIKNKIAKVL